MRIGALINTDQALEDVIGQVRSLADQGFDGAFASQIFGYDTLTVLALAGSQVPGITLGTGVVPVQPRHPMMLAQQALTVQAATGNRLVLGIGLSHQMVVEGMWGYAWDRPARYMREYLEALVPILSGETVSVSGEFVTCRTAGPITFPGAEAPPVVVAALGETMLRIAGRLAAGTATWMTGTSTVADHIVPTITTAAEQAGRPAPRVVVALPVAVTADVAAAKERIDRALAIYPTLPSYKAMLDREGASAPSDVALVGDEATVAAGLDRLAEAGATDFVADVVGTGEERATTYALLAGRAGAG